MQEWRPGPLAHHPCKGGKASLGFGILQWEGPGLAIGGPSSNPGCVTLGKSFPCLSRPSPISHNDALCFIAFSSGRFLTYLVLQASQHLVK